MYERDRERKTERQKDIYISNLYTSVFMRISEYLYLCATTPFSDISYMNYYYYYMYVFNCWQWAESGEGKVGD